MVLTKVPYQTNMAITQNNSILNNQATGTDVEHTTNNSNALFTTLAYVTDEMAAGIGTVPTPTSTETSSPDYSFEDDYVLDDDYQYDYSVWEEHERQQEAGYQDLLEKIQNKVKIEPDLSTFDIFVDGNRISREDLFVQDPPGWDPKSEFLSQVVGKLYLVVPALLVGILIGLTIWSVYLFSFKLCYRVKQRIFRKKQDPKSDEQKISRHHIEAEEFYQISPPKGDPNPIIVDGKQMNIAKVGSFGPPTDGLIHPKSFSTLRGLSSGPSSSSSSTTPLHFETCSDSGPTHLSSESSLCSAVRRDVVLRAVDDLADTIDIAIKKTPVSSRGTPELRVNAESN